MQTFRQETEAGNWPTAVKEVLAKLWNKAAEYALAYAHPACRRTSNMVDRLTNRLYRILYAHRGLHGHQSTSELRQRGHCLLLNFCPFAPRAGKPRKYHSPAHRLNQKQYHDNWLENLLISASLGGLSIALLAYRLSLKGKEAPVVDGLTGEQRVFFGWAQVWRTKSRDAEAIRRLAIDPHSPPEFRCNGVIRNIDAFYDAFEVSDSDELYLEPARRVRIWS